MTLTFTVPEIPILCWVWTGLVGYLLLTYLVLGPMLVRRWHQPETRYAINNTFEMVMFWIVSPVSVPVYYLWTVVMVVCLRIAFGRKWREVT